MFYIAIFPSSSAHDLLRRRDLDSTIHAGSQPIRFDSFNAALLWSEGHELEIQHDWEIIEARTDRDAYGLLGSFS